MREGERARKRRWIEEQHMTRSSSCSAVDGARGRRFRCEAMVAVVVVSLRHRLDWLAWGDRLVIRCVRCSNCFHGGGSFTNSQQRERERGFFDRDLGKNKKPMLSKVFKLIHKKDSLMSEQPELLGKIRTDQLTETYVRGRNEKNET